VTTTRRFQYVKPGEWHTCALALSGAALCWGLNTDGQLGTGGSATATPTLVAGGHIFDVLAAPPVGRHTCGVTTGHQAFCWGDNAAGQLGDGTLTDRPTPVGVVGPSWPPRLGVTRITSGAEQVAYF
jgi:alpha-tubulin suppressor-like RCC1 family protein